jgi:hypothetical protein
MPTVLSHIVQKRYSQEYENIATDALAYILDTSESAHDGMTRLLHGIVAGMPGLRFRTQQTAESIRPDMWGYDDDSVPRVFVESKFWAGLTDNQPVSYLKQLAECAQPTILLVVVPEAREETLWRELSRRLQDGGISSADTEGGFEGVARFVATSLGPILAITTWNRLLSSLSLHVSDDPAARSDLLQLQALCDAADSDAFVPMSAKELSDQRTPALVLDLNAVWQTAVELGVTQGVLDVHGLMPQASSERTGRYARFSNENGVGMWIGVHLKLWRKFGSPMWLVFTAGTFGRLPEVRPILEPWAAREGVFCATETTEFLVALDIAPGEEKDHVVRSIVDRLHAIGSVLAKLASRPEAIDIPVSPGLPGDLREFVDTSTWTHARTMPEWPHEYIVREHVDAVLFERLVRYIRASGYQGAFYSKPIVYMDDGGLVYWTMGAPLEKTTIVNRCQAEDSYQYRLAHGTLPPVGPIAPTE